MQPCVKVSPGCETFKQYFSPVYSWFEGICGTNRIDEYEKKHYPIDAPDPIEAIKIRMEEMHLKQVDLINEIGERSRVSEILNRKRKLTVEMIRNLHRRLNLSPGLLINDYPLTKSKHHRQAT